MREKKTKIVRIIARLNVGGPARHVVWLSEALTGERFETKLIAGKVPQGEQDMAYFAEQHGVAPVFVDSMSRELSIGDLRSLFTIWRILVREQPDVIHTHTAKAGTLGRLAAILYRWITPTALIGRPRKVFVTHTFHGHIFDGYYGRFKTKLFLLIERFLARFASAKIVVISQKQREEITEKYNICRVEKCEIIRLGLDLAGLKKDANAGQVFRKELDIPPNNFIVAAIGRLTEIKNLELFIEAARVFQNDPDYSHVSFVIIGDGHLRNPLEEFARDSGMIFAGNRNDLQGFYSAGDIVALTSLNEGTPLSLIEAMAFGIPWVASSVGGVPDLAGEDLDHDVDHAESDQASTARLCEHGILFERNDLSGLISGIRLFVDDPERAKVIGEAGREFVSKEYSKDRLLADIKRLYGIQED